jgi:S-formylglutathione hydrolase FrmB
LHPFGRYSNACRFAGEVDVWEALEDVKTKYRVDDERISVRGFSMGGAGVWGFAVHYSDRFFAANPGAGFSETQAFLNLRQLPAEHEVKLWNLYDAYSSAINLSQLPTVAYSGEIDGQKQAADVMEAALAELGMPLEHIIGPNTGHNIHADS